MKKKNTYISPEQHILTCCLGPQNDGGEVGEVWEVRQRHCLLVAS